jgi:hypothetical protein
MLAASSFIGTDKLTDRESASMFNCRFLLDRLKAVIEDECSALMQSGATYHGQFTERKNQLLRDLIVAQRSCNSPSVLNALEPQSRELQALLKRNQSLLKAHIDAVKEVSSIIVDSIRQGESDGTYSRRFSA